MAATRRSILVALTVLSLSVAISAQRINVQGTILCAEGKNSPAIKGATAKVECMTLTVPMKEFKVVSQPTNRDGVYSINFPATVNGNKLGRCLVSLNSSPLPKCNVATNVNNGVDGVPLNNKFRQTRGGDRLYTIKSFFYNNK